MQAEILSYRSENGVRDFRSLPFKIERQHIYNYMNNYYKPYVMNSFKTCSTMPVFEGSFQPPLEKRTYVFERCQFNVDDFPILVEGFYKIDVIGYGELNWSINFTGQLNYGIFWKI